MQSNSLIASYAGHPWASLLNQSAKVATIFDVRNLFHFPTHSYPQLVPVISQTPGLLTAQGSISLILFRIREGGYADF